MGPVIKRGGAPKEKTMNQEKGMKDIIFAGAPDFQAVFLWEYIRFVDELYAYTLGHAESLDVWVLHGFTSRIEALRDDLAAELPPDPRIIPFGGGTSEKVL
jgi:hypothetical protein